MGNNSKIIRTKLYLRRSIQAGEKGASFGCSGLRLRSWERLCRPTRPWRKARSRTNNQTGPPVRGESTVHSRVGTKRRYIEADGIAQKHAVELA
jgi:hypothetical protein